MFWSQGGGWEILSFDFIGCCDWVKLHSFTNINLYYTGLFYIVILDEVMA